MLAMYIKDPRSYPVVCPGLIAMTLLFGSTSMAAIVVTFEKRSGTFQRLLLAPVTYRTIILGKATSAAAYGTASSLVLTFGLVVLLAMPLAHPLVFVAGLLLGAVTFSLLGLIASVVVREVFEAMTLMNFFRFPILFISGVFVPMVALPTWAKSIAMVSPLTYIIELLRYGIHGQTYFGSFWIPTVVSSAFAVVSWAVGERVFQQRANR
jgi:ABC-2 type transport system permease protein